MLKLEDSPFFRFLIGSFLFFFSFIVSVYPKPELYWDGKPCDQGVINLPIKEKQNATEESATVECRINGKYVAI